MKIIHIHQYFNNNMGYQENIFPAYQKDLGNEVILITSTKSNGFTSGERTVDVGETQENGFIVKRININGEFKNRFVKFINLDKELVNLKPDYIYHHSATAPSIKVVAEYKKKNPKVFLCIDNHADLNISARNKLWKWGYYNFFWKKYLKKYDKYIDLYFGVTPTRCLFLEEELGVAREKIRLLPIGADTRGITDNLDKKTFFEMKGLDSQKLTIVHGGKITKEKQIDRILKGFFQIDKKDIQLVLFGKLEDKNVEKLMEQDERIKYIGWLNREETLMILKSCDIGIWNTQHTTVLEDCVAVGLPMILRYYGSTSHLVKNNGMFLYDGAVKEIYDKLNFIVNNESVISDMKEKAKEMQEILSYENIAKESIEYMYDKSPKKIHSMFMNKKYSDTDFKYFRIINRE